MDAPAPPRHRRGPALSPRPARHRRGPALSPRPARHEGDGRALREYCPGAGREARPRAFRPRRRRAKRRPLEGPHEGPLLRQCLGLGRNIAHSLLDLSETGVRLLLKESRGRRGCRGEPRRRVRPFGAAGRAGGVGRAAEGGLFRVGCEFWKPLPDDVLAGLTRRSGRRAGTTPGRGRRDHGAGNGGTKETGRAKRPVGPVGKYHAGPLSGRSESHPRPARTLPGWGCPAGMTSATVAGATGAKYERAGPRRSCRAVRRFSLPEPPIFLPT